jgi:uncharacterized damage-inducible protein DinB
MTPTDLLKDAFGRVVEDGLAVVDGLTDEQLTQRVGPEANTIAWLVWHASRVQDDHVADVAGSQQVWTSQGFAADFGLTLSPTDTGYGHTAEQVGQVRASAAQLAEYLRATHDRTIAYLDTVGEDDLDRVVDTRWDPPVTLGVRLVSIVNDDTQHIGQAAYVRGLLGL